MRVKALGYFDEGDAANVDEATRDVLRHHTASWDGSVSRIAQGERQSEDEPGMLRLTQDGSLTDSCSSWIRMTAYAEDRPGLLGEPRVRSMPRVRLPW